MNILLKKLNHKTKSCGLCLEAHMFEKPSHKSYCFTTPQYTLIFQDTILTCGNMMVLYCVLQVH